MRNLRQLPAFICAGIWISTLTPAGTNVEHEHGEVIRASPLGVWVSGEGRPPGRVSMEAAWDDRGQQLKSVVTT